MYTSKVINLKQKQMQIIYGLTHPYECEDECIHCNWTTYYDWVKEEALKELEKWNAENPDEPTDAKDWEVFLDQAIDEVAKMDDVQTTCSQCYDNED